MGTPEFAVPSLKRLIDSGHECAAVITAADKAAGRGLKTQYSAIKTFALSAGLKVLQPEKLKNPDFLAQLKSFEAELFVVVAFRMLPKEVWSMPSLGCFNLHSSLLPHYRGAAPIQWAIWNGELQSGVTTFLLDEEIDTGKILKQSIVDIPAKYNAGNLHDVLMIKGADLVVETAEGLKTGALSAQEQTDFVELKHAPKIFKEDTFIPVQQSATQIHNQIRALSPYPGAVLRIVLNGTARTLKIFSAEVVENSLQKGPSISIDSNDFFLFCGEGCLQITELQPEGRKRMRIKDFLNGIGRDWKENVDVLP